MNHSAIHDQGKQSADDNMHQILTPSIGMNHTGVEHRLTGLFQQYFLLCEGDKLSSRSKPELLI